jgi:hypothetical protein
MAEISQNTSSATEAPEARFQRDGDRLGPMKPHEKFPDRL